MYSVLYIVAFIGIILIGAALVVFYFNVGRLYGHTLSQWVGKTRLKGDEVSAEKLMNVRKHLEMLAHDLLKHRLLGLDTLTREMRLYFNENNPKQLTDEELNDMRNEFFRLCGMQSDRKETLWKRLRESFQTLAQFTGKRTVLPYLDPLFSPLVRFSADIRKILWRYVEDKDDTDVTKKLSKLDLSNCVNVYPSVLKLADSSQMVIEPELILQNALTALDSQTHRTQIQDHVKVYHRISGKLLSPIPHNTLVMCLTRLMDNALDQGEDIGLDMVFTVDDFTGESYLTFKIYDVSEHIPRVGEYGMGLKGLTQSLNVFGTGIQYRSEKRDQFQKAVVISMPASEYADCPVFRKTWKILAFQSTAYLVLMAGFVASLIYVMGGPHVKFAGHGETIMEFSVDVGDSLEIPLCEGGRNVRAEVWSAGSAYANESSSLPMVLDFLMPCAKGLDNPFCPGSILWTPRFEDGLRQGKNYEIIVHCISDGPPMSEDKQRIRVLVKRPNSAPIIELVQINNETQNSVHYLGENQNAVDVDVTDVLHLKALATDADADVISYILKQPDGKIQRSSDGYFSLQPEWSLFGTSTFELSVSDSITQSEPVEIVLNADRLHPIELRKMSVWTDQNVARQPCEGNADARICRIPDRQASEFSMQLWFDPLLHRVSPIIEFGASDALNLEVRPMRNTTISAVGDLWEIYALPDHSLVGFIEFTNMESTDVAGVYNLTFNITTTPELPPQSSLALNLLVYERTRRLPEFRNMIVFVSYSLRQDEIPMSAHSIELTEYEDESDSAAAHSSIWIYAHHSNQSQFTPFLDGIVCQTPGFSDAFETPVVRSLHNAWRVDFSLKRGCIPGLTSSLTSKQRLCATSLHFDDNRDEYIWMVLQDRACSPTIESLELVSSPQELADNILKWKIRILSPDEDVSTRNVQFLPSGSTIRWDPIEDKSHLSGLMIWNAKCDTLNMDQPEILISSRNGHVIRKKLDVLPNCPPVVSTMDNQTRYTVDEGRTLSIPLKAPPGSELALNAPFGRIHHGSFVWEATCRYGKGPHIVEIQSESGHGYGRPLKLEIEVTRCLPRFTLSLDQSVIQPGTPIQLPMGKKRRLQIQSDTPDGNYRFIPQTLSPMPGIQITEKNVEHDNQTYRLDIECTQKEATEILKIQVLPLGNSIPARIPEIVIPIECGE